MKSIKLLIVILFICSLQNSFSQLANVGTYLIANKNDHPTNNTYKYSACWGYRAPNGREYAIIGCQPGTAFYDITDSANVHEVGFQTGPTSEWREMKVYSHYAYIVTETTGQGQGLQIVDMQYLPDSIHYVTTFVYSGYTHTHSISKDGPYLYLNGGNVTQGLGNAGGIRVIDLTNPENPMVRGYWATQYVHDCRVRNDTIYACNIYDPPGSISVINAANKDNLTTITSWHNLPNAFPHNCALTPGRTFCLTTDETQSPNGKLKVWNISDLSNITYVTNWMPTNITTAIVHNVEIYGNYAIIAHYEAGIRIINISNPASPTEVAWYDTYPSADVANYYGCWGVFMFPSGKILGSDTQTGLYVIKTTMNITAAGNNNTSVPKDYALSQNFPNPFNPSTTIRYSIPKNIYASIRVYDVLGKQVALLEDGYKQAGSYSVTYDASNLATGMYFYTLVTADGFSQTEKMILVK